ncbi:MAG: protein with putative role during mitosis [Watsoniomyces obsoletus]|nr:MAG: protein with putative role during mitosis [Watsoniomyces obsoletus]
MFSSNLLIKDAVNASAPSSTFPAHFKLDEGYSEETRSQTGSEAAFQSSTRPDGMSLLPPGPALPAWITTLGEADRSELAYMVLRSLPTSSVAGIVERLHPLLHLDPAAYLPPELMFHVFSFLDPSALLAAALTSRAWRSRALDARLWRSLYVHEGWAAEHREIRKFESQSLHRSRSDLHPELKAPIRRSVTDGPAGDQPTKRRAIPDDVRAWKDQVAAVSADEGSLMADDMTSSDSQDEEMADAGPLEDHMEDQQSHPGNLQQISTMPADGSRRNSSIPHPRLVPRHTAPSKLTSRASGEASSSSRWNSQLTLPSYNGERKLDWLHLFKQRRRLEDNWNAGRAIPFQLPHPQHPGEAHRECVYTIQYTGRFLVSGSRDKTIRVWNLDTQRLAKAPLTGHAGSVLCLQFDAHEDEDVIISGSSDTDVIIWRFSTGTQFKKIRHAHSEPVLNLRFDRRYLVTCSKDKTIKIWNRRQLRPTDDDFPMTTMNPQGAAVFPAHILNLAAHQALIEEGKLASRVALDHVPEYSLLMSLRGHDAAVNAIQLYGDQIVSASGDRKIKIWDVRTGLCESTISGHNKGIACVQYDGRRIVSGSSDNTVKIFDGGGAELACLKGHQDLVRTVQAGFADVPGSDDEQRAAARYLDRDCVDAGPADDPDYPPPRRFVASRKPRSNDTPDGTDRVHPVGAMLPPGGGGSRWGRIVSGSYDQTIIIWKRDAHGTWVVGRRLYHEEAARAAVIRLLPGTGVDVVMGSSPGHAANGGGTTTTATTAATDGAAAAANAANAANAAAAAAAANMTANAPTPTPHPGLAAPPASHVPVAIAVTAPLAHRIAQQTVMELHGYPPNSGNYRFAYHLYFYQAVNNPLNQQQALQEHPSIVANWGQPIWHIPSSQTVAEQAQAQAQAWAHYLQQHHLHYPPANIPILNVPHTIQYLPTIPDTTPLGAAAAAVAAATAAAPANPNAAAMLAGAGANNANNANANDLARVFKLQFDARRIICCSANPRIVGWDFANGDEELIEASRFFQGL